MVHARRQLRPTAKGASSRTPSFHFTARLVVEIFAADAAPQHGVRRQLNSKPASTLVAGTNRHPGRIVSSTNRIGAVKRRRR